MGKTARGLLVVGIFLSVTINTFSQDQKKKRTEPQTDLNGDYKHTIPSSQKDTIKISFGTPVKDTNTINRNYKQQNQPIRKVRFKDHFRNERKRNRESYKHPQGL